MRAILNIETKDVTKRQIFVGTSPYNINRDKKKPCKQSFYVAVWRRDSETLAKEVPKILLEVGGRAVLDWQLDLLKEVGDQGDYFGFGTPTRPAV